MRRREAFDHATREGIDDSALTDPKKTSEVEVRLVAEGTERTCVELEPRNLDHRGEGWQGVREGVDGDQGWPLYLEGLAPCPPRRSDVPIATVEVDRRPDEAFAYATDPARFAEWRSGVVTGRMETSGPTAVGDKCLTTRRVGFARRVFTSEVTHVDPPRSWGVRGIDGPIRPTVDVTVAEATAGGSGRVAAVATGWTEAA